jgi:hypothetical protein
MITEQDIRELSKIDNLSDRLERAVFLTNGNVVEIGGGEGINTIRFLLFARERKKTVIVVDPFEQIPGADESYFKAYAFKDFMDNLWSKSPYLADHLRVIREPSQAEGMLEKLKAFRPIGFVYVDGLQDKASVLSDLIMAQLLDAEIICVDDYDRLTASSQVPLAVLEFLKTTMYKFIPGKREAYFIR